MKLKESILRIFDYFGIKSFRTKNIVKHITISFFYKGGAVSANFLLVPMTIDYLDTENYGVWLTLSSFIAWFAFFDIGLGNGLRNKLAEAKTNGDQNSAKSYISTAYYTIMCISMSLFLIFTGLKKFIDWSTIFNTSNVLRDDLNILMPIIIGFFCIQLVVNLITSIHFADQNHSIQVKIHFLTQFLSLLSIWILTKTTKSSLLTFGIVFSALPIIILLIFNFIAFSNKFKDIKPSIKYWNRGYLKDIMGVGFDFFIIQIAGIVMFSTDNFIITKLFSPQKVVPYNISFKYFSIVTMLFTMVVTPYWSSFTEAYVKKDYTWIRTSVKNIMKIWLIIPFLLFFMVLISGWFYHIWVGDKVNVPFMLSVSMAFFVLLLTFNVIFVFFINGTGKIRLQLYLSVCMALVNIPLSIYFARSLDMGLKGVILATVCCYIPGVILMPIQYLKIINKNDVGIWGK